MQGCVGGEGEGRDEGVGCVGWEGGKKKGGTGRRMEEMERAGMEEEEEERGRGRSREGRKAGVTIQKVSCIR